MQSGMNCYELWILIDMCHERNLCMCVTRIFDIKRCASIYGM